MPFTDLKLIPKNPFRSSSFDLDSAETSEFAKCTCDGKRKTRKRSTISNGSDSSSLDSFDNEPLEPSSVLLTLLRDPCPSPVDDPERPYRNACPKIHALLDKQYKQFSNLNAERKHFIIRVEKELFNLKRQKNFILRRESELLYIFQETLLQEEHKNLKDEVHFLQNIPNDEKSKEDKKKEETMIQKMIAIVQQRHNMLMDIDIERLRENEEDNELYEEHERKEAEWNKYLCKKHDNLNYRTDIELNGERPMAALQRQISFYTNYPSISRFRINQTKDDCTII